MNQQEQIKELFSLNKTFLQNLKGNAAKAMLPTNILSSQGKDIKAEADLYLERKILDHLKKISSFPILSEETSHLEGFPDEYFWIVDPLDGTYNYSRKFPFFSISLALWKGEEPLYGFILDLANDALYSGIVGEGAYKNNTPLKVSDIDAQNKAVLSTGFPVGASLNEQHLLKQIQFYTSFKKVRMIGCASLSLALVAEGIVDYHCEEGTMLWDVAAGLAIVKAAGGDYFFSVLNKQQGTKLFLSANNGKLPLTKSF